MYRFTFESMPDVMSASQSVIRASTSSPASNNRRRTAESVTISSERIMGRRCRKTIFCTNFMCSFIGSFRRRNIAGTIFDPTTSCWWNVHPTRLS